MKPPLTYYGGKQKLADRIISMMPVHRIYCEPFFGGGAVFFAKTPVEIEVISDINGELINFYKVLKNDYKKLNKEIKATLHSREEHQIAEVVLKYPKLFSEVKRAWAVWTLANQSYASRLGGTWRCDFKDNSTSKKLINKRNNFTEEYAKRLEQVQIDNRDAIKVIQLWDTKESFFYLDPPYFNSNMGHYKGYTEQGFEDLLKTLSVIKGKFILSYYEDPLIRELYSKYRIIEKEAVKHSCGVTRFSKGNEKPKSKELLIMNY